MTEARKIKIGYGRADITPTDQNGMLPIEMNSKRTATHVTNHIFVSTVALSDGESTNLLISVELRSASGEFYENSVTAITKATGIKKENILFSVVHNHSCPDVKFFDNDNMRAYKDLCYKQFAASAVEALEDMSEFSLSIARGQTPSINFVRRYLMSDGSWGSIAGKNPGTTHVRHESDADPEVQIIRFERDGKKDIILVNWQCHPARMYPPDAINGDYIYHLREKVESDGSSLLIFFQGAAGNCTFASEVDSEMVCATSLRDPALSKNMGEFVAKVVCQALENAQSVCKGIIKQKFDLPKFRNNRTGEDDELPNFYLTLGDIAFVSTSMEMFHQHGEYVKKNSPFKMTVFVGYANGYGGYMPTEETYAHGGYEVNCCRYVPNTGDRKSVV